MSASVSHSLKACAWLVAGQVRRVWKDIAWLSVTSLGLSLSLAFVFVYLLLAVERLHPDAPSAARFKAMPSIQVVAVLVQWLESKSEEGPSVGPLPGVRVWLDCPDELRCRQGDELVSRVGAARVDRSSQAQVWLSWGGGSWEVSSPTHPKYVLPAAVVFHTVAQEGSPQSLYGKFEDVVVLDSVSSPPGLSLAMAEQSSRILLSYIILVAWLFPAFQMSVLGATEVMVGLAQDLERGACEPLVLAVVPPWALFLARSLALGVLSFGFSFGVGVGIQAFVGWVHPIQLLSVSLVMAAVSVAACMAGLTLSTLVYSRALRTVLGHFSGPLLMLVFLLVLVGSGLAARMVAGVLGAQVVDLIPVLEWPPRLGVAIACLALLMSGLVVGALVALGQSRWVLRRQGLKSNRG